MGLRITNWNVNGIRNPFGYQPWTDNRTFQAMFDILEADIVIMQEAKIQSKDLRDDMVLVPGWDVFFSLPRHKKGYSGVAIYTRNSVCCPIRAEEGITGILCSPGSATSYRDLPSGQQIGGYPQPGQLEGELDETVLDSEGRCVILEFPAFVLIGVYCPAARDNTRAEYRLGFQDALDIRVRNLVQAGKSVILAGDLNIIRSELDFANGIEQIRKDGMTLDDFMNMPSRRLFNQLVFEGRVIGPPSEGRETPVLWDLCRLFHPNRQGMFTCWDTKKNARPGNFGARIDYILCSDDIKAWFTFANIQEGLMGSDHCPIFATLGETVKKDDRSIDIRNLVNPPGMFEDGNRKREWSTADLLPLSAKLLPEFDRRQSIRDMFFKKGTAKPLGNQAPKPPVDAAESLAEHAESQESGLVATASDDNTASKSDISDAGPSTQSSATSSSLKRPITKPAPPARPIKKSKAPAGKEGPAKSTPGLSQRSLAGFFKSATPKPSSVTDEAQLPSPQKNLSSPAPKGLPEPADEFSIPNREKEPATPSKKPAAGSSKTESPERVFDPIESKESWSKLLKKRVVPRCEHGEPCITYITKKPGVNMGRSFFICPRPLGPSGEKEKGTQWRCSTFIWSSDWKEPQS